nr:AarF/ABC1/UbiB kinase family protein [Paludibacterium denitrificans]
MDYRIRKTAKHGTAHSTGGRAPLIQKALGAAPDAIFQSFEATPVGSASIAQVHRAVLQDGTPVAVKLRRPGIVEKVDADLRILSYLAGLIELEFPDARRFQPTEIVSQFARSLKRELDLAVEAHNMERFARDFADDPTVVVPRVYWDYTNPAINVQDYIDGIPASQLDKLAESGLDSVALANHGADAVLKMILINGFFHADPHPGNVFSCRNNASPSSISAWSAASAMRGAMKLSTC